MAVAEADTLVVELREESPGARAWRRLLQRKSAVLGLVIIVLFVLIAVFAPLITPYDPTQQSWTSIRKPPSLQHWFGTDESGRDLLLARDLRGAGLAAGGRRLDLDRARRSACRSGCWRATAAAGSTPSSAASPMPCWRSRS